jgi:hypothetical protein
MIYRGSGFLADNIIWLLTPPLPPLPSVSWTCKHTKTEKERQLAGGRGRGEAEEPDHKKTKKHGPEGE